MVMSHRMSEIKADGLDRRAALYERQADEREARAAPLYGGGSYSYLESLDRAEAYRRRARALRDEAAQLRRTAQ